MNIDDEIRERAEELLYRKENDMGDALGIEFLSISKDEIKASMPVNENTVQPFRILHGGASVALAETLASIGAYLNLDNPDKNAVGLEINANHIRPVREGSNVIGTARPIHRGSQTQVWEIRITTEDNKLVCVSRCTLAVVKARRETRDARR